MSVSSWIIAKLVGDLVTDYGSLPSEVNNWRVSVTLRKRSGNRPHLVFECQCNRGKSMWAELACTPKVHEKLDAIFREALKRIDG